MIGSIPIQTEIFLPHGIFSSVGCIETAGYVKDTWRKFTHPMRTLGVYALVFVLDGKGKFRDSQGINSKVNEGDVLLLFPGIEHAYGPANNGKWSEIYAHFDGEIFDFWSRSGVLDFKNPVLSPSNPQQLRNELELLLKPESHLNGASNLIRISAFANALVQMIASARPLNHTAEQPLWLRGAINQMKSNAANITMPEIARQSNMPYHTFLRRFKSKTGFTPAAYRRNLRITHAKSLLSHTNMPIREIAALLNFSDEFHFSNRFNEAVGMRPSEFRKMAHGDGVVHQEKTNPAQS